MWVEVCLKQEYEQHSTIHTAISGVYALSEELIAAHGD